MRLTLSEKDRALGLTFYEALKELRTMKDVPGVLGAIRELEEMPKHLLKIPTGIVRRQSEKMTVEDAKMIARFVRGFVRAMVTA